MSERDRNKKSESESTFSGEAGERNRNTPGRTPRELGLDAEEMRGHDIIGESSDRTGDVSFRADDVGNRKSPAETPGVENADGGLSASGGRAGGARGNSGTS